MGVRILKGFIFFSVLGLLTGIAYLVLWHIRYYPDLFLGGDHSTEGAEVYIDGRFVGVMKDRRLWARVGSGNHDLRVVKAGYKPYEEKIYVIGGEGYFNISLKAIKGREGQSLRNQRASEFVLPRLK